MNHFQNTNFSNKKVLIRVDFNVPMDDNKNITDDTRIRSAIPTIKKVLQDNGNPILMSHLGRPKGKKNLKYSLQPLVKHIENILLEDTSLKNVKVLFAPDCIDTETKTLADNLQTHQVLLIENLRFYKEEEKGDKMFAEKLSQLGEIYINDAFGSAHRAHASTSIIAEFFPNDKKMFGLLMEAEVTNATKVLKDAQKPFTAIIGGAKVSDKILILENLINKADTIIIGGGMAYTFLKAQGYEIGKSIVEEDRLNMATAILDNAKKNGVEILLPIDHHLSEEFSNDANNKESEDISIPSNMMGLDIGTKTIDFFYSKILKSKSILWNGPMGVFEFENFKTGTKSIALAVAEATKNGAFSLVGGGDSVSAINTFNLKESISYVSTGGGALLEFFEGKTLPGIVAITRNS